MKRLLLILLAMLLLCASACAELGFSGEVSGTICYPQDADTDTATYVYTYTYPLAEGDEALAAAINEQFAYMIYEAENFTVPIQGEMAEGSEQAWSHVTGAVTCLNGEYASVLVVRETELGEEDHSVIYAGYTFSLTGAKAGTVTSLPYLLGILDAEAEADEWLEERQAAKAEACVRQMVWDRLQEVPPEGLYETADEDWLSAVFYPEDDFYLDAEGNIVFYISPGMMAPAESGALLFSFTVEEILDEL